MIMNIVAVGIVLLFAAYIFWNYNWRIMKAKWYGTETDAYVSRIEKEVRTSQGVDYPRRFFYVIFQEQNGLETEARLLNPKGLLVEGDRVRIRYLPEKSEYAVLT